jgi:hypothetical protein
MHSRVEYGNLLSARAEEAFEKSLKVVEELSPRTELLSYKPGIALVKHPIPLCQALSSPVKTILISR